MIETLSQTTIAPTISERVALARSQEAAVRAGIVTRLRVRLLAIRGLGPPLESGSNQGSVQAIVAGIIGMSRSTYQRARAIVVAAETDPERYGYLVAKMDRTGNVQRTYFEFQLRQKEAELVIPKWQPVPGRSVRAAARRGKVIAMRQAGYREDAIAAAVDLSESRVRHILAIAGLPTISSVTGTRANQRHETNTAIEALVSQLTVSEGMLREIDWGGIDSDRCADWSARLRTIRGTISTLQKHLKDIGDGHG